MSYIDPDLLVFGLLYFSMLWESKKYILLGFVICVLLGRDAQTIEVAVVTALSIWWVGRFSLTLMDFLPMRSLSQISIKDAD